MLLVRPQSDGRDCTQALKRPNFEAQPMPRYFLDVKDGHRLFDAPGFVCEDDTDAIIKATVVPLRRRLQLTARPPVCSRALLRSFLGQELIQIDLQVFGRVAAYRETKDTIFSRNL